MKKYAKAPRYPSSKSRSKNKTSCSSSIYSIKIRVPDNRNTCRLLKALIIRQTWGVRASEFWIRFKNLATNKNMLKPVAKTVLTYTYRMVLCSRDDLIWPVFSFIGKILVPEIIDPVFAKTSPKCSFCMTENERFGLVFAKTGSINSGTCVLRR